MSSSPTDEKLVSKLLLIGLAVVILAILVMQYNKQTKQQPTRQSYEQFAVAPYASSNSSNAIPSASNPRGPAYSASSSSNALPYSASNNYSSSSSSSGGGGVMPSDKVNEVYKSVNYGPAFSSSSSGSNESCAPRDKLTASDLLPKDAANSKWAQVAPAGQGDVTDQNFLTAGYLVGVNTIGQSKKNGNLQIRSDPPIEKIPVGPWQMSTIESSTQNHRTFEIGDC